jgi:hypothetical protein
MNLFREETPLQKAKFFYGKPRFTQTELECRAVDLPTLWRGRPGVVKVNLESEIRRFGLSVRVGGELSTNPHGKTKPATWRRVREGARAVLQSRHATPSP